MIKKRETCLYCGEKMESITAKRKFCCNSHRLYWHRENAAKKVKTEEDQKDPPAFSEFPPMPTREKGENAFDFAARKNEWKQKYNQ